MAKPLMDLEVGILDLLASTVGAMFVAVGGIWPAGSSYYCPALPALKESLVQRVFDSVSAVEGDALAGLDLGCRFRIAVEWGGGLLGLCLDCWIGRMLGGRCLMVWGKDFEMYGLVVRWGHLVVAAVWARCWGSTGLVVELGRLLHHLVDRWYLSLWLMVLQTVILGQES